MKGRKQKISKDDTLVFPNANYHLAQKEYDFWISENPDLSKSKNTQVYMPLQKVF